MIKPNSVEVHSMSVHIYIQPYIHIFIHSCIKCTSVPYVRAGEFQIEISVHESGRRPQLPHQATRGCEEGQCQAARRVHRNGSRL